MAGKFKLFWSLLWAKIKNFWKWILGITLALILLIVGLVVLNNHNKTQTTETRPEVAQVYEPSISTPLPPDTTQSDSTTSASDTTNSGKVESASTTTPTTNFVAPKSGVDSNVPIEYENQSLQFKAILPPHTKVVESYNSVIFYSEAGSLLYSVNVVTGSDSLDMITQQLKSSPDIFSISKTIFANNPAIQFSTKNQVGYVISKNNQIFYLIGYAKYLTNIQI